MKRKKKAKPNHTGINGGVKGQAFNQFQKAMHAFYTKIGVDDVLNILTKQEMRDVYKHRIVVRNPEAAPGQKIPGKELKQVGKWIQYQLRKGEMESGDRIYSPYELQLMACMISMVDKMSKSEVRSTSLRIQLGLPMYVTDPYLLACKHYLLSFFRAITALSNVQKKYYCLSTRNPSIVPDNPEFEIGIMLWIYPARCKHFVINRYPRPAYLMGSPLMNGQVKWNSVPVSLLGTYYKGGKSHLELYIQSHALNRLRERLDLLDEHAINYTLWENTSAIQFFEFYKGYILLPYLVHSCRIGYLMANIIQDALVIRTFLFITHASTPEGDKLRAVSGLGKEDISYWRIDRLSTFFHSDPNRYPGLVSLFEKAGFADIFKLKECDLGTEALQNANLDGLLDYIQQEQNAMDGMQVPN